MSRYGKTHTKVGGIWTRCAATAVVIACLVPLTIYDVRAQQPSLKDSGSGERIRAEYGSESCTTKYCYQIVCFKTILTPVPGKDDTITFLSKMDDEPHYGCAKITVPKDKHRGFFRFDENAKNDLRDREIKITIQNIKLLSKNTFSEVVKANLPQKEGNTVNVFVHGYNTSLHYALARAGQQAFDMGIEGPVLLYSWPAGQEALEILQGMSNIRPAEGPLLYFLNDLASWKATRKINIIAHSLAAKLVLDALSYAQGDYLKIGGSLGQIVLAAPMADLNAIKTARRSLYKSVRRITIFCSTSDNPIKSAKPSYSEHTKLLGLCEGIADLSAYTPDGQELGYDGEEVPVDVINIEEVSDCWFLEFSCSHSLYNSDPSVLQDIASITARPDDLTHPMRRGGLYVWSSSGRRNDGLKFRK
jgi:esterase/lipase superfamily enzyme